jgi:hypothetical protein
MIDKASGWNCRECIEYGKSIAVERAQRCIAELEFSCDLFPEHRR